MRWLVLLVLPALCLAQEETCTVEGQVFNDSTGEPLKKAHIVLRSGGSSAPAPYGALSDASGRFAIAGVRPGRYFLSAERNGFVRAEYGGRGRRGAMLTLTAGQRLTDVTLRLLPHAVIAGRVLDEDGEPVASVQVTASRPGYRGGKRALLPAGATSTNDLGEYRLAGLAPGRYYVSARYRGMGSFVQAEPGEENYVPTYYPGTTDPAAAAPLQVTAAAQFRGIDINLQRARTVRVTGRVTNPAAGALAGRRSRNVMVFLAPREGGPAGIQRNSSIVQEGNFEIRNVLPGAYVIAAHWYEDGQRFTASQPLDVGNADVEGITLTLSAGFELAGRIRVEGGESLRLAGVRVTLEPATDLVLTAPPAAAVKADGSFSVAGVPPDRYTVQVSRLPEDAYVKSARIGENQALEAAAEIAAGAGPLEIVLSRAGGRVEGVVADDQNQPASGAAVVLVPDEQRRARPGLYKAVSADQQGRFTMRGIAPGDYVLFAWTDIDPGAYRDPEFLKRFEKEGEAISIRENGRESAQLKLLTAEEK